MPSASNLHDILKYPRWDLIVMWSLFGAIFVFEMMGVFGHFVTITETIRTFIPRWARWMILGWLIYHFGVQ